MKYDVVHVTRYVYTDIVTLCHNQAHLTPRETLGQRPLACQLDIHPPPATIRRWTNAFGNASTYFTIEQPHRELSVVAESQVEVEQEQLPTDSYTLSWEDAVRRINSAQFLQQHDPIELLYRSDRMANGQQVREYAAPSFAAGRTLLDATLDLTHRIHADFDYDPAATTISTTPAEILERRRGVCQDFAHLQISCLRALGLLARYVSGYIVTRPPPGKPRLVGADATHAWVSVFFPDYGWIGIDPTNDRLADAEYITLAWGRDYVDVSPVRGVFIGGGAHQMSVSVDVVAAESPAH
jgi:transglutaminase-like putative cysteine protease